MSEHITVPSVATPPILVGIATVAGSAAVAAATVGLLFIGGAVATAGALAANISAFEKSIRDGSYDQLHNGNLYGSFTPLKDYDSYQRLLRENQYQPILSSEGSVKIFENSLGERVFLTGDHSEGIAVMAARAELVSDLQRQFVVRSFDHTLRDMGLATTLERNTETDVTVIRGVDPERPEAQVTVRVNPGGEDISIDTRHYRDRPRCDFAAERIVSISKRDSENTSQATSSRKRAMAKT